jgi:hypothetical protein
MLALSKLVVEILPVNSTALPPGEICGHRWVCSPSVGAPREAPALASRKR